MPTAVSHSRTLTGVPGVSDSPTTHAVTLGSVVEVGVEVGASSRALGFADNLGKMVARKSSSD